MARIGNAETDTPTDALEAQKRKRLELEAAKTGLAIRDESDPEFPLAPEIDKFLADIRVFRKKLTCQKYQHVLELFAEHVAPKSDARDVTADDIKKFLAWRKSKGFDPGTTLYTDRVIPLARAVRAEVDPLPVGSVIGAVVLRRASSQGCSAGTVHLHAEYIEIAFVICDKGYVLAVGRLAVQPADEQLSRVRTVEIGDEEIGS